MYCFMQCLGCLRNLRNALLIKCCCRRRRSVETLVWHDELDTVGGIDKGEVEANGFVFSTISCGDGTAGQVLMLHGFPEWRVLYSSLMRKLAAEGYRCVAYNQRGYSPGASPSKQSDYHYDLLRDDIFAVADALGFDRFHLVGHDHGALLGWYTAGSPRGEARLLTYTALSIPHPNALSSGLYGAEADIQQQMASQYFTIFTLPESASIKHKFLFRSLGLFAGFRSPAAFQKAIWWYNGCYDAGVLAMPPLMSIEDLMHNGNQPMAFVRSLYGGTPDAGRPQTNPVGTATMPVLYVAGNHDFAILGTRPFAQKTQDFCTGGYTYLEVSGGHNPLACKESGKVFDAVVAHLRGSRPDDLEAAEVCITAEV